MKKGLALVVDDSKTARMMLKHMLERHNIQADTVDSAEMAIDYLVKKSPDLIFMDHMMPGMDGLQAVKAIKSNPETATIPIMMYTSKEGDLYLSQARALGALGILPKQVQPAELFEVLNKLGLVEDRRAPSKPIDHEFLPLDEPTYEIPLSASRDDIEEIASQAAAVGKQHVQRGHPAATRDEYQQKMAGDIRKLRTELDQLTATRSALAKGIFRPFPAIVAGTLMFVPLLCSILMLAPLTWSINKNSEMLGVLQAANRQIDQLKVAKVYRPEKPKIDTSEADTLREQVKKLQLDAIAKSDLLYDSIAWGINQGSVHGINEEAYSDRRLAMMQELLERLQALGFTGTVQLHSYLGEYCLIGNESDGYEMPPPELPVTDCTLIGHPLQDVPSLGERQSIAFADFLSTSPLLQNSGINLDLVPHLYSGPRNEYPPIHKDITAGEWNRIAAANNQVEVTLIPNSEGPG